MPKTWFTRETFNPRRLGRDQHSTSSHANIQAMQFYKTLAIYYCIENIENATCQKVVAMATSNLSDKDLLHQIVSR